MKFLAFAALLAVASASLVQQPGPTEADQPGNPNRQAPGPRASDQPGNPNVQAAGPR